MGKKRKNKPPNPGLPQEKSRFPSLDGLMPIEGAETPRSFGEGTGKRKYAKDDVSVIAMRKARARGYRQHGIGVPGSGSFVLTKEEMARQRPAKLTTQKTAKTARKPKKPHNITPTIAVPEFVNPYDEIRKKELAKANELMRRKLEKQARKRERRKARKLNEAIND